MKAFWLGLHFPYLALIKEPLKKVKFFKIQEPVLYNRMEGKDCRLSEKASLPFSPEPYEQKSSTFIDSLKPERVHVIVNPAAGQEMPVLSILNRVFQKYAVKWEVFVTKGKGDAQRFARNSVQAGIDAVLVCGGDGTLKEAAESLFNTGMPLGILPYGSANVMSLELFIPKDLAKAAELIVSGHNQLREVDMGLLNGNRFLLRAGIGTEARVILDTTRQEKNRWGNLAYILQALSELTNPDQARYQLDLDGMQVEVSGLTLFVGNTMNTGLSGVSLVKEASVSDGLLDAVLIRSIDLPALVSIASKLFLDHSPHPNSILHWQAREIRVMAVPPQPAEVDGEPGPMTPLVFKAIPRALRVITPTDKK